MNSRTTDEVSLKKGPIYTRILYSKMLSNWKIRSTLRNFCRAINAHRPKQPPTPLKTIPFNNHYDVILCNELFYLWKWGTGQLKPDFCTFVSLFSDFNDTGCSMWHFSKVKTVAIFEEFLLTEGTFFNFLKIEIFFRCLFKITHPVCRHT